MLELTIKVKLKNDTETEFINTLINELKDLAGYKPLIMRTATGFECRVVEASSAHYVLKKWIDRGMLIEE